MMKIKAIAVDDTPMYLKALQLLAAKVDFIELQATFTDPEEALAYLRSGTTDLVFLDVEMPAMSGIEFCKRMTDKPMVIFTTAYDKYAVEAFNLEVLDYFMKPYTLPRFIQAMSRVREYYRFVSQQPGETEDQYSSQYLILKVDYGLIKIHSSDIILVEGLNNYMKIYLQSGPPIIARITRKQFIEYLPPNEFVRVHRSFIVSLSKIEKVRKKIIVINRKEIPIGKSFEEQFFTLFNKR